MNVSAWVMTGLLLGAGVGFGQELSVTVDPPNGVYAVGQTARWTVAAKDVPAAAVRDIRYTIKKGGLTLLREGTLTLSNGTAVLEAPFAEPGTLIVEAAMSLGPTGRTMKALGGAVAAPATIVPSATRPDDFDAFWAAQVAELAKIPVNPKLEPGESGKTNVDYWTITMDNIGGSHIRGQVARPTKGGKFPAVLIVQWAGVYSLHKGWVTDRAREGWLALNINAHDLPIDKTNTFYQEQSNGPLKDYPAIGNDDREASYFRRMYLSCYQAAQYLAGRDDWDGKVLVVTGGSQGGLQTLMLAGLHPKITAALANVPAGCDMLGPDVGRAPGWPMWYWKTTGKDAAKVRQASRYYDVVNFASRIKCPVLVGLGLIDQTCPAAGVLAAINQIPVPKEVVIMPTSGHQEVNKSQQAYYERWGSWMGALLAGKPAPLKPFQAP